MLRSRSCCSLSLTPTLGRLQPPKASLATCCSNTKPASTLYLFSPIHSLKLGQLYCNWWNSPSRPSSTRYFTVLPSTMADARYCVEYAKSGRSTCKKCKQPIEKGAERIGKVTANPFGDDGGEMKAWYHMRCIFETLKVHNVLLSKSKHSIAEP